MIACVLLCASPAIAAKEPELPTDSRIRIFTYSPADVYTVPTKYGYQTSIVFAKNEEISTVSVGDRSMWQIIPSGNRIFLRPMNDGLATNMTVITNIREYNFDIKSITEDKKDNLYVIQFRYPDKKNSLRETLEEEVPVPDPIQPVRTITTPSGRVAIPPLDTQRSQTTNSRYTYTGPDAIAPAQVYDDGKNTYVVYNSMPLPAPVPVVRSADGKQVVAAHKLEGDMLVVQSVSSGFVLKSPSGDITVYNEMFK